MKWDDEKTERLKKYSYEHLSASEIGRKLGFSKNAVIGKLRREGFKWQPEPKKDKPTGIKSKIKRIKVKKEIIFDDPECFLVEIDGAKSLYEIRENECRFLVKNGCCARRTENSSYCVPHQRIVFGRGQI